MKKKKTYDQDEGIQVNERGRVVNRDVDEDERRGGGSVKKGGAKKRLKKATEEAETRLVKRSDSNKEGYKKRAEQREAEEKKPGIKKKKKTAGDLLDKGKTKAIKKKLGRFESKALAIAQRIQNDGGEHVQSGALLPVNHEPSTLGSETEFFSEYGRIFGTLQAIQRKLEATMLSPDKEYVSSKDIYALSTLYSQMRETISDMRSIKDMNAQAASFSTEIMHPLKRASGEVLIAFFFKVNQIVRQHVHSARDLESILESVKLAAAEQGGKLDNEFQTANNKIIDVLNGSK